MRPDPNFQTQKTEEELARIQAIEQKLTPTQKEKIRDDCNLLSKRQNEVDNPDILPRVGLADIPLTKDYAVYRIEKLPNEVPVWYFNQPTNGITHIRFRFNIESLPESTKTYLPLYVEYDIIMK